MYYNSKNILKGNFIGMYLVMERNKGLCVDMLYIYSLLNI